MKKPLTYGLSVVISLLLVFAYLGLVAGGLMKLRVLRAQTAMKITESEQIAQKVHDSLTSYYKTQENVSGISADTYEDGISVETLTPIIRAYIENGFGYINRTRNDINVTADFTELENDIRAFFVRYANENGYQHDSTFDAKVQETIDAAENNILSSADVYHFRTLSEAGYLGKMRTVASWADYLLVGSVLAMAVLMLVLSILYRKEYAMLCYWAGTAVLVGSILMLIPALYLQLTRWFDRFAVKEDAVFAAVTGLLYSLTGTVITAAIIGIVLALAIYILFGVVLHASPERARREAKRGMEAAHEK